MNKATIIQFLKGVAIPLLLSVAKLPLKGPWGFVAKRVASMLLVPVAEYLYRKGKKLQQKIKGSKRADKLEEAETADDYLNSLNSK